jgi:formamidopyrimidine-DNA glycosylase
MPELPDVTLYVEAVAARAVGHRLNRVTIRGPFLLRSTAPPVEATHGKMVRQVLRVGKRIALGLEDHLWLALHLMIAGRLHWRDAEVKPAAKPAAARNLLAAFAFDSGTLTLTEAGARHRASLHVLSGPDALRSLDAGGLEVLTAPLSAFTTALQSANHTLKRALTDPHIFSGIGNSYSDEILHRARLSPVALSQKLPPAQIEQLYAAARGTLVEWTARLRAQSRGEFPEKVTAFREGMAVHGRFGLPCPRCGAPIQRIRYASNETNYCAPCQTNGKLLADRALSRLLREDWPRSLDELEALKRR